MKRKFKQTLASLLVAVMLIMSVPIVGITAMAAEVIETGSCGYDDGPESDNATYTLYDDGTLVISGTGSISGKDNDSYKNSRWDEDNRIKAVVIEEGITEISEETFDDCPAKSIDLPDSLKIIGDMAFYFADIKSITIPENVETIGSHAFDATDLKSIHLPASVREIGMNAFEQTIIKSFTIDENNPYFTAEGNAIYSKSKSTLVQAITTRPYYNEPFVVPEGVTRIGKDAFHGGQFAEIILPSTLNSIGDYAFTYCQDLRGIEIPEGVTSIGYRAFAECESLKYAVLPESLTYIYDYYDIFENTGNGDEDFILFVREGSEAENFAKNNNYKYACILDNGIYENIPCGESTYWSFNEATATLTIAGSGKVEYCTWYVFAEDIKNVVIAEGVTEIADNVFGTVEGYMSASTRMTSLSIPSTLTDFGNNAAFCVLPCSITAKGNFTVVDGILFNKDKTELVKYPAEKAGKEYTIPATVKKIGEGAFLGNTKLEKVIISDGVEEIGDQAFALSRVKEIIFPTTLKTIGDAAFFACVNIETINLPDSVKEIGDRVFSNCASLTTLTYPKDVNISQLCFEFTSLKSVYVPYRNFFEWTSYNLPEYYDFGGVNYDRYLGSIIGFKKADTYDEKAFIEFNKSYSNFGLNYSNTMSGLITPFDSNFTIEMVLDDELFNAELCKYLVMENNDLVLDYSGITVTSHYDADFAAALEEKGITYIPYDSSHVVTYTYEEASSCTESAVATKVTCSVCGVIGENIVLDSGAHNVESWSITKDATCQDYGSKSGVCIDCGQTVTETIPCSDHHYGEWITTLEPSRTEEGKAKATCMVCGATREKTVPVIPSSGSVIYDTIEDIINDIIDFGKTIIDAIKGFFGLFK